MSRWIEAPLPRDQIILLRETLVDRIPEDHPVRLLWEILDGLDWSSWEQHEVLVAGQPPIHPNVVAAAPLQTKTGRKADARQRRRPGNPHHPLGKGSKPADPVALTRGL